MMRLRWHISSAALLTVPIFVLIVGVAAAGTAACKSATSRSGIGYADLTLAIHPCGDDSPRMPLTLAASTGSGGLVGPEPQDTSSASDDSSVSEVIEWSGIIIAAFTFLLTTLLLATGIFALFGFGELRRARDRAATLQEQMVKRLNEIESLANRWEVAVQEADSRVETIVQSAYGFNQGQEAYAAGNYQRAVDFFRRASQLQPRSTTILYKLGRAYTNLGDLTLATDTFNACLAVDPSCDEAYRGLALAYRYDVIDTALSNAASALEAGPTDLKNWNCFGLLLRDEGRLHESIEAHERARSLDESQPVTAFYLALLYAATGRLAQACELIHVATRNLESDEANGRIKQLWAAVLHWARSAFDHEDGASERWARIAADSCQSGRRVHEVRGHMLFLLTALGRTGLIDTLPEVLRSPPTHLREDGRDNHA